MGHRGMAATRRGRTTGYAAALAAFVALLLAPPTSAQSTAAATPTAPPPQPHRSKPPPGVVVHPAPLLRAWRCVRHCESATTGSTGAVLRLRGRALGRSYEVVFLGAEGAADDVAAAPLKRSKKVVTVRVPLGAVSGPPVLADRGGLQCATPPV